MSTAPPVAAVMRGGQGRALSPRMWMLCRQLSCAGLSLACPQPGVPCSGFQQGGVTSHSLAKQCARGAAVRKGVLLRHPEPFLGCRRQAAVFLGLGVQHEW